MNPSNITIPEDLGPAMRACSEGQRRFVLALLETGGDNYTKAAMIAGYAGTPGSIRVTGHQLAHHPKVIAAAREEADRRLRGGAILGASVMIAIASDPMHKDRFKAADRLLGSAGLNIETVSRHIIEDHRSDNELLLAIAAIAKKNGLDPSKLLGRPLEAEVVDAEFTEVGTIDTVEESFEGLEDIL